MENSVTSSESKENYLGTSSDLLPALIKLQDYNTTTLKYRKPYQTAFKPKVVT